MNTPIRVFILAILLSVMSIGMRQYTNHSIISQRKAHQSESTEAELQKKVDYVNNLLNDLYRADNYKNGTRNQRKELAGEILSRMEKDGYITRERSKEDERVVLLKLTEKGYDMKEKVKNIPAAVGSCVPLEQDEAAELYKLLYKILGNTGE